MFVTHGVFCMWPMFCRRLLVLVYASLVPFQSRVCLEHILFANSYSKLVSKCGSNPMGTFFSNSYALTY
jgi:hypothetical protein